MMMASTQSVWNSLDDPSSLSSSFRSEGWNHLLAISGEKNRKQFLGQPSLDLFATSAAAEMAGDGSSWGFDSLSGVRKESSSSSWDIEARTPRKQDASFEPSSLPRHWGEGSSKPPCGAPDTLSGLNFLTPSALSQGVEERGGSPSSSKKSDQRAALDFVLELTGPQTLLSPPSKTAYFAPRAVVYFDELPVPSFGVDRDMQCTMWNRKMADLSGWSEAQIISEVGYVPKFFSGSKEQRGHGRKSCEEVLRSAFYGRDLSGVPFRMKTRSGQKVGVRLHANVRTNETGQVTGLVCVVLPEEEFRGADRGSGARGKEQRSLQETEGAARRLDAQHEVFCSGCSSEICPCQSRDSLDFSSSSEAFYDAEGSERGRSGSNGYKTDGKKYGGLATQRRPSRHGPFCGLHRSSTDSFASEGSMTSLDCSAPAAPAATVASKTILSSSLPATRGALFSSSQQPYPLSPHSGGGAKPPHPSANPFAAAHSITDSSTSKDRVSGKAAVSEWSSSPSPVLPGVSAGYGGHSSGWSQPKALVADSMSVVRNELASYLERCGLDVVCAASPKEATWRFEQSMRDPGEGPPFCVVFMQLQASADGYGAVRDMRRIEEELKEARLAALLDSKERCGRDSSSCEQMNAADSNGQAKVAAMFEAKDAAEAEAAAPSGGEETPGTPKGAGLERATIVAVANMNRWDLAGMAVTMEQWVEAGVDAVIPRGSSMQQLRVTLRKLGIHGRYLDIPSPLPRAMSGPLHNPLNLSR